MKNLKLVYNLVLLVVFLFFSECFAEVIYTKDGSQIQAKIDEVTKDTVWYETVSGDVTEYIGMDRLEVVKILNDDGTVYVYEEKK